MRSNKRFTNTTFTKRVDHEAGRHRPKRAPKEPAVCSSCGARYVNRRWSIGDALTAAGRRPAKITCTACKQKKRGVPCGYLSIQGGFIAAHRKDIETLLINEAERTLVDNPLATIMKWQENADGTLILSTTTEHLAQRLGHALEKAFAGTIHYDFSHENKLARVSWYRD